MTTELGGKRGQTNGVGDLLLPQGGSSTSPPRRGLPTLRQLYIGLVAAGLCTSGRVNSDTIPSLAVRIADDLVKESHKKESHKNGEAT